MKSYLGLSTKVEDVITPRSLFKYANEGETLRAQQIAEKFQFDSVPLLQKGAIRKYWSREDKKVVQISGGHRVLHDTPIEAAVLTTRCPHDSIYLLPDRNSRNYRFIGPTGRPSSRR
jgi:hypothetical protein